MYGNLVFEIDSNDLRMNSMAETHTITLHMVVRDAGKAADWYKQFLDAVENGRVPLPGGKFMQIELQFGDTTVMLADEVPEMGVLSPLAAGYSPVALHYSTKNVDTLWAKVTSAGVQVLQPLQEQFWGERYGQIADPFGYRWGLAQRIREVPADEIAQLAAKAFGD
jgi:PhnB protein